MAASVKSDEETIKTFADLGAPESSMSQSPLDMDQSLQQLTTMSTPIGRAIHNKCDEMTKTSRSCALQMTEEHISTAADSFYPKTHLLGIPAELRKAIFGYVLCGSSAPEKSLITIQTYRGRRRMDVSYPGRANEKLSIDLLSTCRQIKQEACAVLYGSNCFTFPGPLSMADFLAAIGQNRRLVRFIELHWFPWLEHIQPAMQLLSETTMPITLRIRMKYMYTEQRFEQTATDILEPLLPLLKILLERTGNPATVIDAIQLLQQDYCSLHRDGLWTVRPKTLFWCSECQAKEAGYQKLTKGLKEEWNKMQNQIAAP